MKYEDLEAEIERLDEIIVQLRKENRQLKQATDPALMTDKNINLRNAIASWQAWSPEIRRGYINQLNDKGYGFDKDIAWVLEALGEISDETS